MRIIVISPHFAEYAIRYSMALSEHHDVAVVVDKYQFDRDIGTRDIGSALFKRLNIFKQTFTDSFSILGILKTIKLHSPQIIHLQEASGFKRALINLIVFHLYRTRAKLILTVHDPKPHTGSDALVEQRLRGLRNWTRKLADVILVHGTSCREQLEALDLVSPERIVVTEHGTLMVASKPSTPNSGQFLMFGRMEAYKGLHVLLDAIAALEHNGFNFIVRIMGSGPELDKLAPELARLKSVKLENAYIETEALIQAITESAFILMPYINATQSGVLAASLGNERPVICSRVGGLPDIVQDGVNGLLVPPGDATALANAMSRVLEDGFLADKLALGAAESAHDLLDWSHIVERLAPIYTPKGG